MKLTKIFNLTVLGAALTITAFGCKTKPLNPTLLPGQRRPISDVGPGTGLTPSSPIDTTGGPVQNHDGTINPNDNNGHPGWAEDPSALKAETVYFEFDKSSIKGSEQTKLDDVATYLKSNPAAAVKVEGNCDERGTEEYNRSLGERRALAAREYLVHAGIDAGRVDTISYGEDKPAETGHSESSWAKNRRDEFVVLTPPKM